MIKETNKENLEKADVMPDNLYYYNAVNDAVSIVEQEAGMKYTFRSEKELQEVIQACAGIPQKVIDNAKCDESSWFSKRFCQEFWKESYG